MRTALVGRERGLDALLGYLDESQQGRANLVVCVGEPGIGKTRLVEELAAKARDRRGRHRRRAGLNARAGCGARTDPDPVAQQGRKPS